MVFCSIHIGFEIAEVAVRTSSAFGPSDSARKARVQTHSATYLHLWRVPYFSTVPMMRSFIPRARLETMMLLPASITKTKGKVIG